ncbi:MAG: VWA domain-containing protein, partial [Methanoregula sp.]|nr:VWA domain-containing protein [Methanoregula sp.]
MRGNAGFLIIIGLLLLVGVSAAHLPDDSTISTSTDWVVANGADTATISVRALNATAGAVKDALVLFTVDNLTYGGVNPLTDITDNSGRAKTTFKVNRTSGVANISARITSPDGYTVIKYIHVNIDHDTPYTATFAHPLSGTVATDVPFNISITDRWGNAVDNRRGAHTISLSIHGPAPDDCGFIVANTTQHSISSILDANGMAFLTIRLTTKVGPNNILMNAFGSIPDKLEWINADTTGIPYSIDQTFTPSGSPPSVPSDGVSKFTIIYTLWDRYGNPAGQQWVWVNTTIPSEEAQFQSNNLGQISITYGPKSSIGTVNITATTVGNSSVTISQEVEFLNTMATNMELTANPETMASRDVNPSITSDITATVTDAMGNPVENELVTFSLGEVGYPGGPYNVTSLPRLMSNSTLTDANGFATVQFIPGSFSTNSSNVSYSATATGIVPVTAIWNSSQKDLVVTWKNYPYLSVKTSVLPPTVGVNDTAEVSIALKGDGWALGPKPIDAILVIDRSGSMGANNVAPGVTRMQAAKTAARTFVSKMNPGTDRLGLVSYSYENDVILNAALGSSYTSVNTSINGLSSAGGTAMREGFRKAIQEMVSKPKPGAVRAVILMTDGNWNNGGSPLAIGKGYQDIAWVTTNRAIDVGGNRYHGFSSLANQFEDEDYRWYSGMGGTINTLNNVQVVRNPVTIDSSTGVQTGARTYRTLDNVPYCSDGQFTNQNMSIYAKTNNIRLYTISFAQNVPVSERTALTVLANSTGGFYKHAPTQADLAIVYQEIAGDLKDEAGVNVTMMADYQNVNVTGVTFPGAQVFSYISHPIYSTKIDWQDGVTNVTNQSADWDADRQLSFNIGTIKVGQSWNATFRLKANQSGSIDIFGANSLISFNGGASTLTIPRTFLTVVPQLNATALGSKTLTLENLTVTEPGEIKTNLPVKWNTSYSGNKTITEEV